MIEELNRQSLLYTVSRQMWCARCKGIMDVAKSVELTARSEAKILAVKAMHGDCWDGREEYIEAQLTEIIGEPITVEVIDGREVF